jgi:hypothetical protein
MPDERQQRLIELANGVRVYAVNCEDLVLYGGGSGEDWLAMQEALDLREWT